MIKLMITTSSERAEEIPFSRGHIAATLGVPVTRLNNWIDRNRLWPTDRGAQFRRSYRLAELFDLAGFAALRIARIPEASAHASSAIAATTEFFWMAIRRPGSAIATAVGKAAPMIREPRSASRSICARSAR